TITRTSACLLHSSHPYSVSRTARRAPEILRVRSRMSYLTIRRFPCVPRSRSSCPLVRTRAHETEHETHQRRDRRGPLQAGIVACHAAVVLGEVHRHQLGCVDVCAKLVCTNDSEIVVLHAVAHIVCDPDPLPNEEQPDAQDLQLEKGPLP